MPQYYQHLVYVQLVLELILLILLALLWKRSKSGARSPSGLKPGLGSLEEALPKFLAEAEKLSRDFSQNLEERKQLSTDLILKLDKRLKEYQNLLNEVDEKLAQSKLSVSKGRPAVNPEATSFAEAKANPAAPETRALVLRLAEKGLSLEEIALKTNLHQGEVELIIDLDRQFKV